MDNSSPILTSRQLEVSELLIEGFSIAEIAEILKIKRSTTQDHCKDVYNKFHSTNLKDCYFELSTYVKNYSPKYYGFDFISSSSISVMEISGEERLAKYTRIAQCISTSSEIKSYNENIFCSSGESQVFLEGKEVNSKSEIRGVSTYIHTYKNPIKFGKNFDRKVEIIFRNCHNQKSNYWSALISNPCIECKFELRFINTRIPSTLFIEHINGNTNVKKSIELDKNNTCEYTEINPKINSQYNFHWKY